MRASWLAVGDEPCLALWQLPERWNGGGVLIVAPFGWDAVCSHRVRHDWAEALAADGRLVLRIDPPSTGDSAGAPADPDRVGAWTRTVSVGCDALRDAGATRISVIALGLGGLLSLDAVAAGAPADELVLWGVPATGRAFRRELRAFARLEAAEFASFDGRVPEVPQDGSMVVGGFALSAETLSAIDALDATALELPAGRPQRALLLDRDGIEPDATLVSWLEAAGADVATGPGRGWGAMMDRPHESRAPREVFARVGAWLGVPTAPPVGPPTVTGTAEATLAGGISERVLTPATSQGLCFALVTDPAGPASAGGACLVLLNAGAIPRPGPNRMWVEAARRWARRGVTVVRLDMPGIGDAEGELDPYNREMGLYVPAFVGTLGELLDELGEQLAVSRFVLAGLCSGAYWAFHAARRDPRVAAAALINPRVLVLDVRERWVRSELGKAGGLQGWKKVLRGQVSPRAVLGRARRLLAHLAGLVLARGRGADPDDLEAMLDELRDERRQITLAFALGEPFEQTLEEEGILGRLERWPNVAVRRLDGYDHTLRPLTLQTAGHAIIDDVLMGATERAA